MRQQPIDDAEDSSGGPDAEHQGNDGGDSETRALAQLAKGEAKILKHTGHTLERA
jgi:hypothetical protein